MTDQGKPRCAVCSGPEVTEPGDLCPACLAGIVAGMDDVETLPLAPSPDSEEDSDPSLGQIGIYTLRESLGEGGFGEVFLAEQTEPIHRFVALKVIKPGMDSEEIVARFEAERQALALMEHPNIAKVYDAGTTEGGRPWFAMEWVRGQPLTAYCDEKKLTVLERIELFLQICSGIQHAHEKGVIHRDIKPSNLLVADLEEKPVPKIIDFGVAKALADPLANKTIATLDGQMMGTPQYMSPEQAEGRSREVDVRSDVYSLGVVLYELFTGATPISIDQFREAGLFAMGNVIRESKKHRPSTQISTLGETASTVAQMRDTEPTRLRKDLRSDLDWIVMRALEPEKRRRYGGAGHLAADLQRYLRHEPVEASPPSVSYRVGKFAARHRGFFFGSVAVVLTLVLGAVLATWQAYRATHAEKVAQVQTQSARARTLVESDPIGALEMALDAAERDEMLRGGEVSDSILSDLVHVLEGARERERFEIGNVRRHLAVSPDARFAVIGEANRVSLVDRTNGIKRPLSMVPGGERVSALAFLEGGILVGTEGGTLFRKSVDGSGTDWTVAAHDGPIIALGGVEGESGGILTVGANGQVHLWGAGGQEQESADLNLEEHLPHLEAVAISSDGRRIVAASDPILGQTKTVLVDRASGTVRPLDGMGSAGAARLAFAPDGDHFFTVEINGNVRCWHWSGRMESEFSARRVAELTGFATHPVERLVAFGYSDGEVQLLDWRGEPAMPPLRGHLAGVTGIGCGLAGADLFTLSGDQTLRVWDVLGIQALPPLHVGEKTESILVSPLGDRIAVGTVSGRVRIFDLSDRKEIATEFTFPGRCDRLVTLLGKRGFVAGYSRGGKIAFFDWEGGAVGKEWDIPGERVLALAVPPDGSELVVLGKDESFFLLRIPVDDPSREVRSETVSNLFEAGNNPGMTFAGDGNYLVLRGGSSVHVLEWSEGEPVLVESRHGLANVGQHTYGASLVGQSEEFITGAPISHGVDEIRLLHLPSLEASGRFPAPDRNLDCAFSSPRGRFLAFVDRNSRMTFHSHIDGATIGPSRKADLDGHRIRSHARHPEVSWVALATLGETVRFWDVEESAWMRIARDRLGASTVGGVSSRGRPWTVLRPQPIESTEVAVKAAPGGRVSVGIPGFFLELPEGWETMDAASYQLLSRIAENVGGNDFKRGRMLRGFKGPRRADGMLWNQPMFFVATTDEVRGESSVEALTHVFGMSRGRAGNMNARSTAITSLQFNEPTWIPELKVMRGEAEMGFAQQQLEIRYYGMPVRSRLILFLAMGGNSVWEPVEEMLRGIEMPSGERMGEDFLREAPERFAKAMERASAGVGTPAQARAKAEEANRLADRANAEGNKDEARARIREAVGFCKAYGIQGERIPVWVRRECQYILKAARLLMATDPGESRRLLESQLEELDSLPAGFPDPTRELVQFRIDAYDELSKLSARSRDREQAVREIESAIDVSRRLFDATGRASVFDRFASLHRRLGQELEHLGRPDDAIRAFRQGVEHLESLPVTARGKNWGAVRLDFLEEQYDLLRKEGEEQSAWDLALNLLEQAERSISEGGGNRGNRYRLAKARTRVAGLQDQADPAGFDRAVELRRSAERVLREMDEEQALQSGSTDFRVSNLAAWSRSVSHRGEILSKAGGTEEAETKFEEATRLAEEAVGVKENGGSLGALHDALRRESEHWGRVKDHERRIESRRLHLAVRRRFEAIDESPNNRHETLKARSQLAWALRDGGEVELAAVEIDAALLGLRDLVESGEGSQLSYAKTWSGTLYGAKAIADRKADPELARQRVEERSEVATRYLEGVEDKGAAIQLFWGFTGWAGMMKEKKLGTEEEWEDLYRRALAGITPFRDEVDANLERTAAHAERVLGIATSEEESGLGE